MLPPKTASAAPAETVRDPRNSDRRGAAIEQTDTPDEAPAQYRARALVAAVKRSRARTGLADALRAAIESGRR